MDETDFLASIQNFFSSALNWATPGNAPSVAPSGTPVVNLGTTSPNFDTGSAAASSDATGSWLSSTQGAYNQDFNFLSSTFASQQAFLGPLLNNVTTGIAAVGSAEANAQTAYAGALSNMANHMSSGGILGAIGL